LCNLDDVETVNQISENIYMQYFLGYSSFTNEAPYDPSLLTDFRKRLGMDQVNAINEKIVALTAKFESQQVKDSNPENEGHLDDNDIEPDNRDD
jgi:hypothetical protein